MVRLIRLPGVLAFRAEAASRMLSVRRTQSIRLHSVLVRWLVRQTRSQYLTATRSGASFIDDVERGLRSSPKPTEACCGYNVADARFSGLRAQAKSDLLRSGTGSTQER
jgi:hypothetical protein